MTKWNLDSGRKPTGGKKHRNMKKKKYQKGSDFSGAKIAEKEIKTVRTRGANKKYRLIASDKINVAGEDGKVFPAKIKSSRENKANVHFVRRNLITKGAVLDTDKGLVKVTSKPGKDGIANGVLVEAKK